MGNRHGMYRSNDARLDIMFSSRDINYQVTSLLARSFYIKANDKTTPHSQTTVAGLQCCANRLVPMDSVVLIERDLSFGAYLFKNMLRGVLFHKRHQ